MPIIKFDGPKMSEDQKAELVKKITRSVSEVLSQIPEQAIGIVITEHSEDDFAVGGELVSRRNKSK